MSASQTWVLIAATTLPFASIAANEHPPVRICLAPVSAEMSFGNAVDVTSAVRDTFTSFLIGPSVSVTPLSARLAAQVREEAKLSECPYILFPTLRHERKAAGVFGRIVAGAVQSGAWEVAGGVPSSATRVIASAASAGAANFAVASQIKTRDSLNLQYRLEAADGQVLVEKKARRSASSDGEDLLTPLVEGAAQEVMSSVSARSK